MEHCRWNQRWKGGTTEETEAIIKKKDQIFQEVHKMWKSKGSHLERIRGNWLTKRMGISRWSPLKWEGSVRMRVSEGRRLKATENARVECMDKSIMTPVMATWLKD